jgi:hypothetical protein
MSDKKLSPLRQKDLRTGAQQERERIIALIESSIVGGYPDADYIVFLIKGENK